MKIEVISISRSSDANVVDLTIRFDGHAVREFKASSEERNGVISGNIEEELFFLLSGLGIQNLCNSAYYHLALGEIVRRFLKDDTLPPTPIDLTTEYVGIQQPSRFQILRGRFRRLLRGLHPMHDEMIEFKKSNQPPQTRATSGPV